MLKRILLWVLGIALAVIVVFGGVAAYKIHETTSQIHSMDSLLSKSSDSKTNAGKSVAYLLLGTDTGELGRTYKGRTDTMMVMVVNPDSKTTTMISLQRDTRIQIDGTDAKLNAAYALGNASQAVDTVNQLLNIKLDGYILVNMKGVEQLVDAVGGVGGFCEFLETINGDNPEEKKSYKTWARSLGWTGRMPKPENML